MADHYCFLPTIDGVLLFLGIVVILIGIAMLGTMLAGIYGVGPMTGWQQHRG